MKHHPKPPQRRPGTITRASIGQKTTAPDKKSPPARLPALVMPPSTAPVSAPTHSEPIIANANDHTEADIPVVETTVPQYKLESADVQAQETPDATSAESSTPEPVPVADGTAVAHSAPDTSPANDTPCDKESAPVAAPTPTPLRHNGHWHGLHEAVVGLSHRNAQPPMPCQDAALSRTTPRPLLIVADGAGSAAVSEIGSQAVVAGLARLLHTLDKQVCALVDQPHTDEAEDADDTAARHFALLLVKHAKGILEDLAVQHRRDLRDFRCTLLLAVVGECRVLWLKIGDGALVREHLMPRPDGSVASELHTIGTVGKGEFANTTVFIDNHLQPNNVQSGLLDVSGVCGLAAMSDGAAEKLISHDATRVAAQLGHWFQALREQKLRRRELTRSFYADAFCASHSGDDCSLALLAAVPQKS